MSLGNVEVTQFFKVDYVDQASYDNLRKIASAIDGLKNSNRKVIHTVLDKNLNDLLKVQQLSAKAAEYTDYLHGSLDGVIVTLGQDYCGSNQVPLLTKKGNFGTRAIPEASAARYIFAKASPSLPVLFNKEDRDILIHQEFEGEAIEPRFFVPTLPVLLINGNRGVSSGFSQLILGRNINQIRNAIALRLAGKVEDFSVIDDTVPYIKGFKGEIIRDKDAEGFRWEIRGDFVSAGKKVTILELPIETNLMKYVQFLEDLKEKKLIKDFKDECDGDNFKFVLTFKEAPNPAQLWDMLKLKSYITENFTSLGADNKIKEFKKPSEILEHYYQTKMEYMQNRKDLLLSRINDKLSMKSATVAFLQKVVDGELDLRKLTTAELVEIFEKEGYPKGDNFKYLLNIAISSITVDRIAKIREELQELENEAKVLAETSVAALWAKDIKQTNQI